MVQLLESCESETQARKFIADGTVNALTPVKKLKKQIDKLNGKEIAADAESKEVDSENGGGVGVRPKPKYDMDAMYAQYPCAKAYLDAQEFAASENDTKSAAGKKALDAIINGENYEQAIAAMNSDWATHCKSRLWD